MSDPLSLRPKHLYDLYAQHLPGVFESLENARAMFSRRGPWPSWCYMPIGLVQLTLMDNQQMPFLHAVRHAPIVVALAAWHASGRPCIQVQPEAETIIAELNPSTPIQKERLLRFPYLCAYFSLGGMSVHELQGIFVYLEYDFANKREEIRFVFDIGKNADDIGSDSAYLLPAVLEIDEPLSLEAAFEKTYRYLDQAAQIVQIENGRAFAESLLSTVQVALGIALWACDNLGDQSARYSPNNDTGIHMT